IILVGEKSMKQCPNPNCVYYTRLEELPDAYVRCPACGGPLVTSNIASNTLGSGQLPPAMSGGLAARDLDLEFADAFPGGAPVEGTVGAMRAAGATGPLGVAGAQGQYEEGEYYPYDQSSQYLVDEDAGPPPLSRMGKAAYLL